jgi:hypothetical protein
MYGPDRRVEFSFNFENLSNIIPQYSGFNFVRSVDWKRNEIIKLLNYL